MLALVSFGKKTPSCVAIRRNLRLLAIKHGVGSFLYFNTRIRRAADGATPVVGVIRDLGSI